MPEEELSVRSPEVHEIVEAGKGIMEVEFPDKVACVARSTSDENSARV